MLSATISVAVLAGACVAIASAGNGRLGRVDHVVIVVFENRERGAVVGSRDAPTFNRYARRYVTLADYSGTTHPSLPNYLALVSGSTQGVTDDCTSCGPWVQSIGGLLSHAGRSWGGYGEGYPSSPRFAKKHMPFLYFQGEAPHVHSLASLDARRLPAYAFVAPDLCHDGHDCSLATADSFLRSWLPPILRIPRTAVFVVFDEGTTSIEGGGQIAAFVAGTAVKGGLVVRRHVDHYTVLRTVEDLFGLPHLGASGTAAPLRGIWR